MEIQKQMFLIKIEQEGNAEVQNNMIIDVKKTLSNNLNEVSFLQTESVGSKISQVNLFKSYFGSLFSSVCCTFLYLGSF